MALPNAFLLRGTVAVLGASVACAPAEDEGSSGALTGFGDATASDDESSDGESSGDDETGETSGGTTSGGTTSGGETTGSETSSGETSGGETSTGTTSGGETSGGTTSGGTTAGSGGEGDPNDDSWEIIDVGTDEDLVAVDFADSQHGWLVGTNEVLLHTDDGGQNWDSQENGFWTATSTTKQLDAHTLAPYPAWGVYHLLDVHAVSNDVAWVSSIGPLKSPVSIEPDHLTAVFVTKDAGANWTRLTLATNFQVWGIHGFDAQSARAATIGSDTHPDSDVYLIYSGANQDSASISWGGLRDITFVDGQTGWAVGAGIFHTTNGGSSWNEQNSPGASYWAVDFVDSDHGWAVAEGGKIVVTANAGQSWQSQTSGTQTDLYGVSFADAAHGFAVGDDGVVLRTDDGGQTWNDEDPGTGQWINDVAATSASEAWAAADNGVLLHRVP